MRVGTPSRPHFAPLDEYENERDRSVVHDATVVISTEVSTPQDLLRRFKIKISTRVRTTHHQNLTIYTMAVSDVAKELKDYSIFHSHTGDAVLFLKSYPEIYSRIGVVFELVRSNETIQLFPGVRDGYLHGSVYLLLKKSIADEDEKSSDERRVEIEIKSKSPVIIRSRSEDDIEKRESVGFVDLRKNSKEKVPGHCHCSFPAKKEHCLESDSVSEKQKSDKNSEFACKSCAPKDFESKSEAYRPAPTKFLYKNCAVNEPPAHEKTTCSCTTSNHDNSKGKVRDSSQSFHSNDAKYESAKKDATCVKCGHKDKTIKSDAYCSKKEVKECFGKESVQNKKEFSYVCTECLEKKNSCSCCCKKEHESKSHKDAHEEVTTSCQNCSRKDAEKKDKNEHEKTRNLEQRSISCAICHKGEDKEKPKSGQCPNSKETKEREEKLNEITCKCAKQEKDSKIDDAHPTRKQTADSNCSWVNNALKKEAIQSHQKEKKVCKCQSSSGDHHESNTLESSERKSFSVPKEQQKEKKQASNHSQEKGGNPSIEPFEFVAPCCVVCFPPMTHCSSYLYFKSHNEFISKMYGKPKIFSDENCTEGCCRGFTISDHEIERRLKEYEKKRQELTKYLNIRNNE